MRRWIPGIASAAIVTAAGVAAGIGAHYSGHAAANGCPVVISANVTHHLTMRDGQLISLPDAQILCHNGTVYVETR